MKAGFFPRLAFTGIKKNAKTYIPYILTCIGCVMMFYMILALSAETGLSEIYGGMATQGMLMLGSVIVGLFSVIFLFYTNSFLIKRRKKELGLYNVLGMGKKHIMRVIFFETVFIGLFTIAVGLCMGMLFSRLLLAVLMKMLGFAVVFTMNVSFPAVATTILVFGCIFLLNLTLNIFRVGINNPIELLQGGNKGEKEPKSNIPLAVIGLLSLGIGYYIAITVSNPYTAILQFFLAVIFVIVGTFSIITAGSTVILKALKKNKKFYYQSKHFISVSGMLYRMKQNAAGIASICILSTMVLVTISTTFCLYFGLDDVVDRNIRADCTFMSRSVEEADIAFAKDALISSAEEVGMEIKSSYSMKYSNIYAYKEDDGKYMTPDGNSEEFTSPYYFYITSADNISESFGIKVEKGEAAVFAEDQPIDEVLYLNGHEYKTLQPELEVNPFVVFNNNSTIQSFVVVVSDNQELEKLKNNDHPYDFAGAFNGTDIESVQKTSEAINAKAQESSEHSSLFAKTREDYRIEFRGVYGSFLFLGIFLGLLFLMATVLIMYYKQISEGYDDKGRFEILEKVGMSQREIKKTIHSQVLMVFFIPLVVAVVHILFAFNMISLIMSMFGLANIMVFVIYTIGSVVVFGIIYTIVYMITAKTYYKIVK